MPKTPASDVLVSAAAGVVATVPMTIAMEELHRALPGDRGSLPPREVTEGVYEQLGVRDNVGERGLQRSTLLLHYAFGGSAGAMFPFVAPQRLPAAVAAGLVYGLAVWSGSYLGWLPALGVRHHAKHDPPSRTFLMIASHLVWGATLGLLLRGRPGLRAASRDPDAPQP